MPLSPAQQQNAQLLYGLAVSRGLPPARAREFVAAAYSESGLNPKATNRSSGAAGFYQLLSGGYRQRAQALGGLYNPRANALAILPDYQSYWRQHPNALPGEAGRDVERSGMGSQFYSRPLSLLGGFGGGQAAPAPRPVGAPVPPLSPAAPPAPGQDPRRALAAALLRSSQSGDYGGFFQTLQNVRQRAIAQPAAQAPAVAPRTVTAPQTTAAAPLRASSTGYVPAYQGFTQGRTDQGVDFSGKGAVRALGDATLVRVAPQGTGTGWPGARGSGTGAMLVYRLDSGPRKGQFVYVAENVDPAAGLKAGSRVRAGQVIATARGYGPMLETGWSNAQGVPVSHATYTEGKVTRGGQDFLAFLRSTRTR